MLKRGAASVTFSDIQQEALSETSRSIRSLIDAGRIRLEQASLTDPVSLNEIPAKLAANHDVLTFNPPQLPTAQLDPAEWEIIEEDPQQKVFRIAGSDGLAVARLYFAWLRSLPAPRPRATIVLSEFLGWTNIVEAISSHGLDVKVLGKERIPLRTQLAAAAERFERSHDEFSDRTLEKSSTGFTKTLYVLELV